MNILAFVICYVTMSLSATAMAVSPEARLESKYLSNMTYPELYQSLESGGYLTCCNEQAATNSTSKLAVRNEQVTIESIKNGFTEISNQIPSFYIGTEVDVKEYELRYPLLEKKAVALLLSFFCQNFPESAGKESLCDLTRRVSDDFERLIQAYQKATQLAEIRRRGSTGSAEGKPQNNTY